MSGSPSWVFTNSFNINLGLVLIMWDLSNDFDHLDSWLFIPVKKIENTREIKFGSMMEVFPVWPNLG